MSTKQDIISKWHEEVLSTIRIYKDSNIEKGRLLWELLPEDLPEPWSVNNSTFGDVWLDYPYDRFLIMKIQEEFEKAGWEIAYEIKESDVGQGGANHPRITFKPKEYSKWTTLGVSVIAEFIDSVDGSTCKRKVIAKKRKTIKVYEYVCNEGAEEKV